MPNREYILIPRGSSIPKIFFLLFFVPPLSLIVPRVDKNCRLNIRDACEIVMDQRKSKIKAPSLSACLHRARTICWDLLIPKFWCRDKQEDQQRGSTKGIRDNWTLTHNHCAKHTVHEDTYINRLHSGVVPPLPLDSQAYNKGWTLCNSEQQDHVGNCDADDSQGRDYRSRTEGSAQPSVPGEVLKGEIHGYRQR